MKDIAIKVQKLTKTYSIGRAKNASLREAIGQGFSQIFSQGSSGKFDALSNVSFEINRGEAVGIIGKNGAGKSTLLKVLSRITQPTAGRVELNGRASSLLEVGTGFHPELTGRENIFLNGTILGMRRAEIKAKFDEIVEFSGVERFLDTPVKFYSSGMYVRLAFTVAAHLEPEILIIDEVLAVGDAEFQKKCIGKMQDVSAKQGRTVLFVSHDMSAVRRLCPTTILLKSGRIEYTGSTDVAIPRYFESTRFQEAIIEEGVIRTVKVNQLPNGLQIVVSFSSESEIDQPNLGFSISDILGRTIVGSNLQKSSAYLKNAENKKSGVLTVLLSSPKLSNGEYSLSIWFGDTHRNFFEERNLLRFVISESDTIPGHNPDFDGYIAPACTFTYQPN